VQEQIIQFGFDGFQLRFELFDTGIDGTYPFDAFLAFFGIFGASNRFRFRISLRTQVFDFGRATLPLRIQDFRG